jgi:hypothetical protein
MTDQEMADDIRTKVTALMLAVKDARAAGLKVHIPFAIYHYIDTGLAPGEPERWTITRHTL